MDTIESGFSMLFAKQLGSESSVGSTPTVSAISNERFNNFLPCIRLLYHGYSTQLAMGLGLNPNELKSLESSTLSVSSNDKRRISENIRKE